MSWNSRVERSVVSLTAEFGVGPDSQRFVTSGAIILFRGRWLWVTADHSLDGKPHDFNGLEQVLRHYPGAAIRLHSPLDGLQQGIRFEYRRDRVIGPRSIANHFLPTVSEEEKQNLRLIRDLDIAFVELSPYYVWHLKSFGCEPFGEDDLFSVDDDFDGNEEFLAKLEGFYISGVVVGKGDPKEKQDISSLPIQLVDSDFRPPFLKFIPRWDQSIYNAVDGMSGGPATAIFDGKAYWFGVQSGQFRPKENIEWLSVAPGRLVYRMLEFLEDIGTLAFEFRPEDYDV